jgi:hypothetical protein
MRLLLCLVFFGFGWPGLRAEVPAPLAAALKKLVADDGRWAYTQTVKKYDRKGRPDGVQVERFDPLRPEEEQWTLLQRDGREPSDREQRAFQRKKEREMRRREEKSLGEVIDFDWAKAVTSTAEAIVYEVPLQKGASRRFPEEKFLVLMTVHPERETLEHFALKAREAFRMVGVARIDRVEIDVSFAVVDPAYAPQPRLIAASGAGRVLFIPLGGSAEITWTDFKRVTPWKDRFVVEFGELKVLDF